MMTHLMMTAWEWESLSISVFIRESAFLSEKGVNPVL